MCTLGCAPWLDMSALVQMILFPRCKHDKLQFAKFV